MIGNSQYKPIRKKTSKHFIILYTLFLILLIYGTFLGIFLTIQRINNSDDPDSESIIDVILDGVKKLSPDTKYTINSYTDTYDNNSITITNYYDVDGNVSTEDSADANYRSRIQYVQIDGLKNKDIQYKINEKLKGKAYVLGYNDYYISSYVTANFSNILSVILYNSNEVDTLNIDLSTGNDIALEDLFVSSATVNSYLANALYKTLAWQSAQTPDGQEMKETTDMTNIDTSEYEDKFLMLINNYKKQKNQLKYVIQPNSIVVYGLIDKNIIDTEHPEYLGITINLIDYIDEVAMYKRFLTKKSVFENDNLGMKNTIVFTRAVGDSEYENRMTYGKLQNNIFIEELLLTYGKYEDHVNVAKDYIKSLSEDQKANLINQTSNSKGTFFQREYYLDYIPAEEYYVIRTTSYQAMCAIDYFRNNAFLDYIKVCALPRVEAGLNGFTEHMADNFPNLEILPTKYESYYISTTGEFLGNTEEEAKAKIREKKQKEEQERLEQERLIQEQLRQEQEAQNNVNQDTTNTISPTNEIDTNSINSNTISNEVSHNVVKLYNTFNYAVD